MTERNTSHNTGLAKVAVQCSADTFVVNQSLVLRINICGENRHLRQARKRYVPFYRNAPNNDKRTVKENKFAYYMFTYYICTDNFVKQNILKCGQQK